eukprot:GILJ01008726.1.p1 GENE.GILJ01008726.1~~GILJ01008726.1.p1  ORF type:complete len:232 (+),score=26.95 GILJ01008726.1:69-698(+)
MRSLEDVLSVYAIYHSTTGNRLIHALCMPFMLSFCIGFFDAIPIPMVPGAPECFGRASIVLLLFLVWYYLYMDLQTGILFLPVLFAYYYLGSSFQLYFDSRIWGAFWSFFLSFLAHLPLTIGHVVFDIMPPEPFSTITFNQIYRSPFLVFTLVLLGFGYRPDMYSRLHSTVTKERKKIFDQLESVTESRSKIDEAAATALLVDKKLKSY